MVSVKQCHYKVLGLPCDCTADKIRSAYRRLALQRHPDKLVQSGLSQSDATAQFQELQHAYEVLSDPKERAWYDSHRSQILFSFCNSVVPDLFSNTVFSGYSDSGKGFYKVYSGEFDKIHANEINFAKKLGIGVNVVRQAPVMGNLDSPYAQVTAFYSYWLGFSTVMDFCWVDEYDVMAVPNLKSRQLMEEENNKVRSKVRKEYNDTVRKLADFVKQRDKRVIDMKVKKSVEKQKKKVERERKKMLVKERKESAMAYEESEWAKVEEEWFGAKVNEEPEWAKVAEEWFGIGAMRYEEPEWARVAEEWFGAKAYEEPEWAKVADERFRAKVYEESEWAKVAEEWFGAKVYEEPEWAKVAEEWFGIGVKVEEKKAEKEFYCVLCEKKFKSEKQWKKHERSKKHKVSVDSAPGSSNVHEEAEGHSIYIRNLPFNATVGQLEEVFKKFGPIKHGGIQVRSSKHGFCFGFVEFEELSSMHSALEASPITVGERLAVVEEKRTTKRVSGSGRGRYPSGRGSFRSESFRGRGKFGGEMDSEIKGNSQGGTRSSQQPNQNGGGRRGRQGAGNRNSTQSTSGRSYCSTKEGKTKTEKTK